MGAFGSHSHANSNKSHSWGGLLTTSLTWQTELHLWLWQTNESDFGVRSSSTFPSPESQVWNVSANTSYPQPLKDDQRKEYYLNCLGNYMDHHEQCKQRFLMPGTVVFINIGFLGEGAVMPSDIISFNIVCVFVYPWVCTYSCIDTCIILKYNITLFIILYNYTIQGVYISHYTRHKLLHIYKITTFLLLFYF